MDLICHNQHKGIHTGTQRYNTNCLFACFVTPFYIQIFFVVVFFYRAFHFHLQVFEQKNNMPIGKSEIVLKVQKCISLKRRYSSRQKKVVHRNF